VVTVGSASWDADRLDIGPRHERSADLRTPVHLLPGAHRWPGWRQVSIRPLFERFPSLMFAVEPDCLEQAQ
jgi:hypothetical protein